MPSPDITVVIPAYNSRLTIARCLRSVLDSDFQGAKEVIVVDSGQDDTDRIVEESFPEVTYIRSARQLLPGAARNLGWRSANSKLIAFLDSDCIVSPRWLQEIYNSLQADGVVTGSFTMANPEDRWGFLIFCSELSASLPGHTGSHSMLAPAGNTSYNRAILEEFGGFLEDTYGVEDTILARRLHDRGHNIAFNPRAGVRHINREGFSSFKHGYYRAGYYSGYTRYQFKLNGYIATKIPLLIPLLLPYRLVNIYRMNVRGKNPFLKRLVLLFPFLFAGISIWTFGFYKGQRAAKTAG